MKNSTKLEKIKKFLDENGIAYKTLPDAVSVFVSKHRTLSTISSSTHGAVSLSVFVG